MASKSKTLIKIIGGVAVLNLLSRLAGFVRDMIISYQFGTKTLADAIFAAYSLPYFLYVVLGGSLTTAFISIYNKIEQPTIKASFRQQIVIGTGLLMVVLSLMFAFASTVITRLFFYGMSEQTTIIIAHFLKVMAPSAFFMVMSMLISGILNVQGYFRLTALSTLVMNLLLIVIGIGGIKVWGATAHSLAVVIGSFAMLMMVGFQLKKQGLISFKIGVKTSPYFKKFFKVFVPILLGGATLQFYTLLQRMFASSLTEGAISSLNYAMKLVTLPQGVVMGAVTTVIFPKLVEVVARSDGRQIKNYYAKGLRWLVLSIVPLSLFVLFFSEDVIRLIFEHGSFTSTSTKVTSKILGIIALSMLFNAANVYVTRFYYAYEKSVTPVVFNILSIFGINVIVTLATLNSLGVYGIALGTMVSTVVNALLLIWRLSPLLQVRVRDIVQLRDGLFLVSFALLLLIYRLFFPFEAAAMLNIVLEGLYFIVIGFLLAVVLKLPEVKKLYQHYLKKGDG